MAVALAQWDTAHGSISTLTATTPLHFHDVGASVFKKSALVANPATKNTKITLTPYTILEQTYKTYDDAGTERYQALAAATEATSTSAPYASNDQLNDVTTPFWYKVLDTFANTTAIIHETDLYNESETETYITANLATWV